MAQHFSDLEKRFVLAEVLKKSNIPLEKLVAFIKDNNVQPDWDQVFLPHGRNLSECKQAFDLLRNGQSSQLYTPQFPHPILNPGQPFHGTSTKRQSVGMPSGPELKKRKSGAETPTLTRDQRDILPKPTHPNNNSPSMTTMSSSPAPSSSQKKRGRPSKADQERRQKEAMDRGEILPPGPVASSVGLQGPDDFRPHPSPVTILPAPRPSQTAVTPGHMLSPQIAMERGPSPTMGSEATVRKRKPKPPAKPKAQKSLEHQFLINTPAGPAGQEETMFTPVSTAAPQAGSMAAPPEAGNPPASTAPTITQDQARMEQPQPENK